MRRFVASVVRRAARGPGVAQLKSRAILMLACSPLAFTGSKKDDGSQHILGAKDLPISALSNPIRSAVEAVRRCVGQVDVGRGLIRSATALHRQRTG